MDVSFEGFSIDKLLKFLTFQGYWTDTSESMIWNYFVNILI